MIFVAETLTNSPGNRCQNKETQNQCSFHVSRDCGIVRFTLSQNGVLKHKSARL